ncbi:MAG TPA: ComEC/Rec2 family competence protein, partial [Rhodomicrobium sp.]|nr:ComEC/Rec2 family competence protein [Rhodomicrobium sp.]
SIAVVRSYLMIAVVFLAILLNRPALSLRNVALSAVLILVLLPDSLIDISFQMSYAATAALIAGYERFGRYLHFEAKSIRERLTWQPVTIVGAVLVTTGTAGLAVEPFSAYYFHNLTCYAAMGNLLGGPPIDFVAMPAMIVALIAMPFGLDEWPLKLMGLGIDAMMAVAKFVASLPGALIPVPRFSFRGSSRYPGWRPLAHYLAEAVARGRPCRDRPRRGDDVDSRKARHLYRPGRESRGGAGQGWEA